MVDTVILILKVKKVRLKSWDLTTKLHKHKGGEYKFLAKQEN